MKKNKVHQFNTDIRNGSNVAKPIALSECETLEYENVSIDTSTQSIRHAYSTLGFLTVRMPRQFTDTISSIHSVNRNFFDLPDQIKNKIIYGQIRQPAYSNIGYYPMDVEKAQSTKVPDRKEFLHIGRSPTEVHDEFGLYTDIPWPKEIRHFGAEYRRFYDTLAAYSEQIFLAIAKAFGLDSEYCKRLIHNGNSILRCIHYPPISTESSAMRAAPHHGMNLIGVQVKSTHPGLQFCTSNDEWVHLDDWPDDVVTVNIGRMLAYMLNGRAKPTLHRVVNDLAGSNVEHRYTSVLFFHGNPNMEIQPLPGSQELPKLTVAEWTGKRLKDIGIR